MNRRDGEDLPRNTGRSAWRAVAREPDVAGRPGQATSKRGAGQPAGRVLCDPRGTLSLSAGGHTPQRPFDRAPAGVGRDATGLARTGGSPQSFRGALAGAARDATDFGRAVGPQRSFRHALAIAFVGAVALFATSAAAALEARLERSRIAEGEAIVLELALEGSTSNTAPDLAPLVQDFEILGTGQSQSFTITNGTVQQSRTWQITLMPKRTGRLVIPVLRAGTDASRTLALEVVVAGAADAAPGTGADQGAAAGESANPNSGDTQADNGVADLFLRATLDRDTSYVNGEVFYTLRIYDALGILQGTLTPPQGESLRITAAGETRTFAEDIGERRYTVHERQFRIAPESAGSHTVAPVMLEARVRSQDPARRPQAGSRGSLMEQFFGGDPFGDMDPFAGRSRLVRVHSNPVELDVQAKPAGAGPGWFLPAESVVLEEQWIPETQTLEAGRAVTRIVRLRAKGASAAQLPNFAIPEPRGARQQETGAASNDKPAPGGSEAIMERRVTLVPDAAGTLTIPPIEVPWFDVANKKSRTATLSGRSFAVAAAPGTAALASGAGDAAPAASKQTKGGAAANEVTHRLTIFWSGLSRLAERFNLRLAGGATILAALLATAGMFLLRRRRETASAGGGAAAARASETIGGPDLGVRPGKATRPGAFEALRNACARNDAPAARMALVAWARETPAPETVARRIGVDRQLDDDLLREIRKLDAALFAPGTGSGEATRTIVWSGHELWQVVRTIGHRTRRTRTRPASPLPALYPE